jgi:hypothetical protein
LAGNRGRANQALYAARILLAGWEDAREGPRWREDAVDGAYRAAVLMQLRRAYGWFLLAVAQGDDVADPRALPHAVASVPPPPAGRELAPELREFALLEAEGWLGELLRADSGDASASTAAGLLGSDRSAAGPALVAQWADRLEQTMQRMDDSLNEC